MLVYLFVKERNEGLKPLGLCLKHLSISKAVVYSIPKSATTDSILRLSLDTIIVK